MSEEPQSPAEPRDGEPYYIKSECQDCGTALVLESQAEEEGWYDEWECPHCKDGIRMDWPASEWERLGVDNE